MDPDVEATAGRVVAYFPRGIDAAYMTPVEARAWAQSLIAAADAADALAQARAGDGHHSAPRR